MEVKCGEYQINLSDGSVLITYEDIDNHRGELWKNICDAQDNEIIRIECESMFGSRNDSEVGESMYCPDHGDNDIVWIRRGSIVSFCTSGIFNNEETIDE